jgi:hypothetical protein
MRLYVSGGTPLFIYYTKKKQDIISPKMHGDLPVCLAAWYRGRCIIKEVSERI